MISYLKVGRVAHSSGGGGPPVWTGGSVGLSRTLQEKAAIDMVPLRASAKAFVPLDKAAMKAAAAAVLTLDYVEAVTSRSLTDLPPEVSQQCVFQHRRSSNV